MAATTVDRGAAGASAEQEVSTGSAHSFFSEVTDAFEADANLRLPGICAWGICSHVPSDRVVRLAPIFMAGDVCNLHRIRQFREPLLRYGW